MQICVTSAAVSLSLAHWNKHTEALDYYVVRASL